MKCLFNLILFFRFQMSFFLKKICFGCYKSKVSAHSEMILSSGPGINRIKPLFWTFNRYTGGVQRYNSGYLQFYERDILHLFIILKDVKKLWETAVCLRCLLNYLCCKELCFYLRMLHQTLRITRWSKCKNTFTQQFIVQLFQTAWV